LDKQQIIAELRRVAGKFPTSHLSHRLFSKHSKISVSTVTGKFGSWNQALQAAGLVTISPGPTSDIQQKKHTDDELLEEVIRLTTELGKQPSVAEMRAKGRYNDRTYARRWGTFGKAREIAYAKYGFPQVPGTGADNSSEKSQPESIPAAPRVIVPQTYKPPEAHHRKKIEFGNPIDFRGLRFAPINEQGVVYLFGMISRELGFLIESIRTDYPDCEGKRCIDSRRERWEHVRIEFEYQSSNFRDHGHNPDDCDLVVCWIHDWVDCPIEVLELRSQIQFLPTR
jgi:hypothetical protein